MKFQAGDPVVHWNYGLGEVIQVDKKRLDGCTLQYYMVKIRDLTIWVPVNEAGDNSLRYPTHPDDFGALFSILSSTAQPLSDDRLMRKMQLNDLLKDGKLASVCQVVRDLTFHSRTKKMNENDKAVMKRAQNFLLSEWALSLSVSVVQASKHLNHLLGEEVSNDKEPVYRKSSPSAWQ